MISYHLTNRGSVRLSNLFVLSTDRSFVSLSNLAQFGPTNKGSGCERGFSFLSHWQGYISLSNMISFQLEIKHYVCLSNMFSFELTNKDSICLSTMVSFYLTVKDSICCSTCVLSISPIGILFAFSSIFVKNRTCKQWFYLFAITVEGGPRK